MLQAKLHAPTINRNIISREKLLTKLQQTQEGKLTLVTAPAGYGKTTAVLDWLSKCGLPFAWLSLDDRDNNPVTFWRYVCAAFEDVADGIAKDAEYVFSLQELMQAEIHINILIDRLSEVSSDFFLILDDLHLINTPSILTGLSHLIDHLPAKMHLILISRTLPDPEWAKHRIKWQVQRLGEEDLRFGEEEILRFYQARGITLQNNELNAVGKYTEGWAAALVAITLSMEEGGGHNAIEALSHSSRDIGQYLRNEVIQNWRPEKLDFAMKTSILDTLWPDLCDAVTGDENGTGLLEEISVENGFLTAVDGQRQAYRYHQLFKSFLQELLQETYPAEIPELYQRAGLWLRERGFIPEAIEHFLSGNDYIRAFELIEHQIDPMLHKFEFGRLLPWVERLPNAYRDGSFKIAVIYAIYHASMDQFDLSRQWIEKMKKIKKDYPYAPDPDWNSYSDKVCMVVEAYLLVKEGKLNFIHLIFSAAGANGGGGYKISEYYDLNTADIYFYRCPISKIVDLFRQNPEQYGKMVESYREIISKNPGYAPLAIGEYLYENNRLEESLPYLLESMEEARDANCSGALLPAMVDIVRMRRAVGDISGAFAALEECEKQLRRIGRAHWLFLLDAFRVRLYLDTGNMEKVQEWLSAVKLDVFTELNNVREFELITYARVLTVMNRANDAQLLLQRLLAFGTESKRPHSRVEILNLLALLAFRDNHVRQALRYIDESLAIGIKEGYVRSFLDELAPMAQLLRAYIKSRGKQSEEHHQKERKAFAASLLDQIRENLLQTAEAHKEIAGGMAEKILDQLTAQEKKVLVLMANADTNEKICETLGISLRTVKTHTGNIYAKLGVKNRIQCLKVLQELKLL